MESFLDEHSGIKLREIYEIFKCRRCKGRPRDAKFKQINLH